MRAEKVRIVEYLVEMTMRDRAPRVSQRRFTELEVATRFVLAQENDPDVIDVSLFEQVSVINRRRIV